ncbi:related to diploid state maintenance protein chpA [Serendipita indica DSM 11827]|uniref:Related to diploid state maintenance protein chpA n=1 Tax=Serendipita indica (strain DSM 11827) TaxID=1109443 RepID=G4TFC3_SERID|nr:related to diploid state maintenance protein chpA [Serendipita indica DSM 11827]
MPKCTRQGCGKEYNEDENEQGACMFHSGAPKFHEGLKSWSCCDDINRPVLDFDSFMKIPGCTPNVHTSATNLPVPKPVQTSGGPGSNLTSKVAAKVDESGKETFGSTSSAGTSSSTIVNPSIPKPAPSTPQPLVEDEDDTSVKVEPGTKCQRNGCKHLFVSDEESRGDGPQSTCIYHPRQPLFHEGSKGYLCCKRRVLEFDEFLKIEGCKTGKHLFVKKKPIDTDGVPQEELVQCRIDHYQTPGQVRASVYAKKVDKDKSTVIFETEQVHLDLILPDSKRFKRTLQLYGPVKPEECSYSVLGTKVDLVLAKQDTRSWNLLEKTDADLQGFTLTFGVGGRTGTVGGKEAVLDDGNKIRT